MNTAFEILVIVLGILLGLFLILSTIAIIFVLKIVGSVRRIVARGEQVLDSAEAAANVLKKAAGPVGVLRLVTGIIDSVKKHNEHTK